MAATYTGRPCRISRKFCILQLPLDLEDKVLTLPREEIQPYLDNLDAEGWSNSGPEHAAFWARSSILNCIVRENILELVLGSDDNDAFGPKLDIETIKERIQ